MMDENGKEMSEADIFKEALDLMASVCEILFETESDEGHTCAIMADNLIKYMQVVSRGDNILAAFCNYEEYEYEHHEKQKKKKLNDKKKPLKDKK